MKHRNTNYYLKRELATTPFNLKSDSTTALQGFSLDGNAPSGVDYALEHDWSVHL